MTVSVWCLSFALHFSGHISILSKLEPQEIALNIKQLLIIFEWISCSSNFFDWVDVNVDKPIK